MSEEPDEGPETDDTVTRVSRKLTGELKKRDRIITRRSFEDSPNHVPVPHPDSSFDESLCPSGTGLDLQAIGIFEREGELFFLKGDSEAIIEPSGRVTLVFSATRPTLEAYRVTLEGLLEFAEVLEKKFDYAVRIVPHEVGSGENRSTARSGQKSQTSTTPPKLEDLEGA